LRITNRGRRLAGLSTTLLLALGITATASAAPAQWVAGGGNKAWVGTLSLTLNGNTKVCPNWMLSGTTPNTAGTGTLQSPYNQRYCDALNTQQFGFSGVGTASTSAPGVYALTFTNPLSDSWPTPWGYPNTYKPALPTPFTVAYTNAVGTNRAKITFNNTTIGTTWVGGWWGSPITATGVLTASPGVNADLAP
jgi:hypothetical protein